MDVDGLGIVSGVMGRVVSVRYGSVGIEDFGIRKGVDWICMKQNAAGGDDCVNVASKVLL